MRTASLILLLLFTAAVTAVHKPHSLHCPLLVVFGDSLSDDGAEEDGVGHGFARNSNGRVWPEYLKEILQCERYVNMAYSSARAGRNNFYFEGWSGIEWQVDAFLNGGTVIPEESIIILQSGGANDFFTGDTEVEEVVNTTKATIEKLVESLNPSSTLVVMGLLDQSRAPGVRAAEDSQQLVERISGLVGEGNQLLSTYLSDLSGPLPVHWFDVNGAAARAARNKNTTAPFSHHEEGVRQRSVHRYAFHDLWHPSTAVHHRIASELARTLEDS